MKTKPHNVKNRPAALEPPDGLSESASVIFSENEMAFDKG